MSEQFKTVDHPMLLFFFVISFKGEKENKMIIEGF